MNGIKIVLALSYARHIAVHFTSLSLVTHIMVKYGSFILQVRNLALRSLRNLPKVIQPVSGRVYVYRDPLIPKPQHGDRLAETALSEYPAPAAAQVLNCHRSSSTFLTFFLFRPILTSFFRVLGSYLFAFFYGYLILN